MEIPASSSLHTNQADEAFVRVGDKSRKLTFDERVQLISQRLLPQSPSAPTSLS